MNLELSDFNFGLAQNNMPAASWSQRRIALPPAAGETRNSIFPLSLVGMLS